MIQQPKQQSSGRLFQEQGRTKLLFNEVLHSMTDINSPRSILIKKSHCHKNNGNLMNGLVLVLKVRSVKSLIWPFERLIGF